MKSIYALFIGVLLSSQGALANPVKVDLAKELSKLSAKNLYDLDPKTKESTLSPLSRMKYFEIKKRWKECAGLGAKVIAAHADIKEWVAASWLRCELKNLEGVKESKNKKALNAPVDWLRKNKTLKSEGPWKSALWQDFVSASMQILENKKTSARVNELLEYGDELPKEARGTLLAYAGEFAEKKKDLKQALYFYEQSLLQKDVKSVREKSESIKTALKLKYETSSAPLEGVLENEGAEAALEEKLSRTHKSGDVMGALKIAVIMQTEYAGSRVSRRLKDKPFEIYQELIANVPRDEKNEKAFEELEKVGAIRLAEWAQTLHRRAHYNQALIFSERALKDLHQTPQSTILYWIAGRSAHFIGQYERAQLHFAKLIEFHAGTEEFSEALLRSGLIHLRLGNFESAKGQFEKLIAQKQDRYDLKARYWLVRSLENINKEKAAAEAKILTERYPFSYYGLRLTAESNKGDYPWPQEAANIPAGSSEMWLIGDQIKAWGRFKTLTKAGWLLEAQRESQELPRPTSPYLAFQFAKFMAHSQQFPAAIRSMNVAMDREVSLRTPEAISLIFPKAFSPWIEAESKKYNLDPTLIRSLIRQESAFGIRALSVANAQGLMQLIPGTAQEVARRLGMKRLEFPEDVFRPEINIPLGTFYISSMIDQFGGNVPFGLAAYNAGPTRMKIFAEAREDVKSLLSKPSSSPMDEIWFDELPWSETSFYVKAILRNSLLYKLTAATKIDWTLVLWQDLHSKKANMK